MITKTMNKKYSGSTPLALGDRYYSQDLIRDWRQMEDRIGQLAEASMVNVPCLISGGAVSKGSGDTLNISAGYGWARYSVEIPDSYASFPPTKISQDISGVPVIWTTQTNLAISSATLNGVAVNYVKIRYNEADGNTRARAKLTGTYAYEVTPSFSIVVDTVAPTDYDICLKSFVGTAGGAFTFGTLLISDNLRSVEDLGTIANNSGTPNTVIDFGAGSHFSDSHNFKIRDLVGMSKSSASWSAGTGNGMLDSGSFTASKVYYLFRILNPTTFAVDYLMSLSDTAPTMPSGYTEKRLIGAVLTNSSIQFIPANFSRPTKDIFRCDYKAQQNDRPEAAAGNTTRNLLTVSAPINSLVLCSAAIQSNSSSGNIINFKLGSTFETDLAPSPLDNDFGIVSVTGQTAVTPSYIYQRASGNLSAIVDSNRQIYWRVSNESITSVRVATKAWQLSI